MTAETSPQRALPWALAALIALWAAAPPALLGWVGGLLAFVGLAALHRAAQVTRHPWLLGWALGAAYMLAVSWSLRHILGAVPFLIAAVGGGYFALLLVWSRTAARALPRALAFATAVAATNWLRAVMPEIAYPHAQPAHALWLQPWLLSPAAWGGEPLVHLLLATVSAAAVDLALAARGDRRRHATVLAAAAATWLLASATSPHAAGAVTEVEVAAVQPGFSAREWFAGVSAERARDGLERPTMQVAGAGVPDPVDLVVWPESCGIADVWIEDGTEVLRQPFARHPPLRLGRLAQRTRLLMGGLLFDGDREGTPCAVLVDSVGRYVGHHEKQRLVPGGERQPFLDLMPASWSTWLRRALAEGLGASLHLTPGRPRPPLDTAAGVPFAALICYDNAFPDVAAAAARAGAAFLCVISNESWYRGGAELQQLAAATVLRAIETGLPVVRATVDGLTMAVDRDGRIVASLPAGTVGVLRTALRCAPAHGPVLPLAPALGWILGVIGVGVFAHLMVAWGSLLRARLRTPRPGREPQSSLPRA